MGVERLTDRPRQTDRQTNGLTDGQADTFKEELRP